LLKRFSQFKGKGNGGSAIINEYPEVNDEVLSITSRETGHSETKKRGFFSRLFRRRRKN